LFSAVCAPSWFDAPDAFDALPDARVPHRRYLIALTCPGICLRQNQISSTVIPQCSTCTSTRPTTLPSPSQPRTTLLKHPRPRPGSPILRRQPTLTTLCSPSDQTQWQAPVPMSLVCCSCRHKPPTVRPHSPCSSPALRPHQQTPTRASTRRPVTAPALALHSAAVAVAASTATRACSSLEPTSTTVVIVPAWSATAPAEQPLAML
jgi:hypothetical protein